MDYNVLYVLHVFLYEVCGVTGVIEGGLRLKERTPAHKSLAVEDMRVNGGWVRGQVRSVGLGGPVHGGC